MATHAHANPPFGTADLSNCEREQIHLAGSIQPHGALLVVEEPDLLVIQVSANANAFLGLSMPLVGARLDDIPGDLAVSIRPHLGLPLRDIPSAVECRVGDPPCDFDCLVHRPPEGGLIIELERAGPVVDLSGDIDRALHAIRSSASLQELCDETASLFQRIAGYDRAMVYRFDEAGHGEVVSERRRADLDSYLGQRYPASDIPQIARKLYERTRVRMLGNVRDERVPLQPRLSPLAGADLDMSLCFLRAMSPIHIQYLTNMGVAATLVASLMVGGKLWGLVACHHYSPRVVHYEIRAVCELLAESVATRIAALESFVQAQAELSVRRLEQRIAEVVAREGDWRSALFDVSDASPLLQTPSAAGAALLFEGEILTTGDVPGTQELRKIGRWLDTKPRAPLFATASLGVDEPKFASLDGVASGLLAAPISSRPGDYLLWFRPARDRVVKWGGDPQKPFVVGSDSSDLSPRRSFAQWTEVVKGTSEAWSPAELGVARLIGAIVADVVLQFRSVRVLIAQDQLDQVRRQVLRAEHPVVVADPGGRILLVNEALERLLTASHTHLRDLSDLPSLFADPAEARGVFANLIDKRRSCRGELGLRAASGETRHMLVRGDPVLASAERLLGFVILFADLTDRREADAARRRFQDEMVAGHRAEPLDVSDHPTFQHLLSAVTSNAQLAALEITEGVDPSRMPGMLEGVRASVKRTAELLGRLVWHASRVVQKRGGRRPD